MFLTKKQLFKRRLKNIARVIAMGCFSGVVISAMVMMLVSDEFAKIFMIICVIVGIIWQLSHRVYQISKIKEYEKVHLSYEEAERKRRASIPVVVTPSHNPKVLFDYEQH